MIDEHYRSPTPIMNVMVGFDVLLPCIRPTRALKLLSFVFRDEYLPHDGIDPAPSLQWNAQLWTSSGDCQSIKSSQS